ncbi:MAG: hypothetical protein LC770_13120, partial [Acidobacteria bacterium]|nr:hypothetical protein [Acidobacteriota bacterium]
MRIGDNVCYFSSGWLVLQVLMIAQESSTTVFGLRAIRAFSPVASQPSALPINLCPYICRANCE